MNFLEYKNVGLSSPRTIQGSFSLVIVSLSGKINSALILLVAVLVFVFSLM